MQYDSTFYMRWFYILLFHLLIEFADNKDWVCACACERVSERDGWNEEKEWENECVNATEFQVKATASYTLWIQIAISVAKENALILGIRVWILTQSLFEI